MPANRTLRQGSQGPDVKAMQALLNTLSDSLLQALKEDGVFGRKTLDRVLEFQRNVKLFAVDGVVGPQTWAMLDKFASGLLRPGTQPTLLGAWHDEPFREAVLKFALAEALPVSNVTDALAVAPDAGIVDPTPLGTTPTKSPRSWRFGWQRLKQYFDQMVVGVNPNYWRQTNEVKIDGNVETIVFLDGVRGNNWRVPNIADPFKGGIQWCGIFATWCWIQAGVPTKWPPGGPPRGVTKRPMNQEQPPPKPGDILVQGGNLVHHSLLLPDATSNPGQFLVVNGNSDFQSVLIKPINRGSVVAYCSLENFAGK